MSIFGGDFVVFAFPEEDGEWGSVEETACVTSGQALHSFVVKRQTGSISNCKPNFCSVESFFRSGMSSLQVDFEVSIGDGASG